MVNEKLPNYVVPDLTDFKVLIFINLKVHLYIFGCCESSKGFKFLLEASFYCYSINPNIYVAWLLPFLMLVTSK